ncbi:MAG TPA: DMT family transporter [Mycobacteriales bacterium]|nr:DMT family transporter [Mycobacteriales bacterium]
MTGRPDRSVAVALAGAGLIAWSAPLVRLADVPPATAAVGRCALAVPALWLLARWERRRAGALPARTRRYADLAGVCFAADLIMWHGAIDAVGAGLATVLGNLQVLFVALAAWWLLGERPHRGLVAAAPLLALGVVLLSGALGGQTYGRSPTLGVVLGLGTSLAYAGFLLLLRQGSPGPGHLAGPLLRATAVAAVVSALAGLPLDQLVVPGPASLGWLLALALSSQVAGWLLITRSLPRLPAAVTSVLLLAQPVGSLAISTVLLGERPGAVQYAGSALVLVGVVLATATRPRRSPTVPPADRPVRPTRRRRTGSSPSRPRTPR